MVPAQKRQVADVLTQDLCDELQQLGSREAAVNAMFLNHKDLRARHAAAHDGAILTSIVTWTEGNMPKKRTAKNRMSYVNIEELRLTSPKTDELFQLELLLRPITWYCTGGGGTRSSSSSVNAVTRS